MYGWFNISSNVPGIMVNTLVIAFFVVVVIAIGALVYAAKQLKKAAEVSENK